MDASTARTDYHCVSADGSQSYSTCGGSEGVLPAGPRFVEKMALLMEQLATSADDAGTRGRAATRFDSISAPATPVSAYIPRLYRHFRCSEEVFVFALIYLDRVIRANRIRISALNIHRLILAASVLGVKFLEDLRYSNRYYARVGGVGAAELNRLELAFLKLIKFDLAVSKEEYTVYRNTVLLACTEVPAEVPLNGASLQEDQAAVQEHLLAQQQAHFTNPTNSVYAVHSEKAATPPLIDHNPGYFVVGTDGDASSVIEDVTLLQDVSAQQKLLQVLQQHPQGLGPYLSAASTVCTPMALQHSRDPDAHQQQPRHSGAEQQHVLQHPAYSKTQLADVLFDDASLRRRLIGGSELSDSHLAEQQQSMWLECSRHLLHLSETKVATEDELFHSANFAYDHSIIFQRGASIDSVDEPAAACEVEPQTPSPSVKDPSLTSGFPGPQPCSANSHGCAGSSEISSFAAAVACLQQQAAVALLGCPDVGVHGSVVCDGNSGS